ncbi:MAG: MFS transporter [Clostridiales bacterium]|nr:MFS transporter [Clostridiales bacterium]
MTDKNTANGNYQILAAAMITSFMTTFMSSALNLSVPSLESYFGVNAAYVSWIVSSYTIAVAAMSLPMGKISDITSRRVVFLTGIAGFGIFSAASIFAPSIVILMLLRALAGTCSAMIFATNNAILISAFPHNVQGKMLGYSVAATYIGLTAGPVAGGLLNNTFGWRSIFAVSVVISAAAFLAAFRAVPKDDESADISHASETDSIGIAFYISSIILSLIGMTGLGSDDKAKYMLAAGIFLLILFFAHENRRESMGKSAIMRVSMFRRSRTFTFSNLAALLNYGATFAISYEMSIYLQVILGFPSGRAGLILIIMPAAQALLSPFTGSLSDRIRPSVLASTGMGICALTLLLYSRIGEDTSVFYVLAVMCMTGTGFAFFSSPNTNAILSCVSKNDYGVANSIIATMRTYGQSSGMAVLSSITALVLGSGTLETSPHADILRMMHVSFITFAGICVIGLFFSLARDREHKSTRDH